MSTCKANLRRVKKLGWLGRHVHGNKLDELDNTYRWGTGFNSISKTIFAEGKDPGLRNQRPIAWFGPSHPTGASDARKPPIEMKSTIIDEFRTDIEPNSPEGFFASLSKLFLSNSLSIGS